MPEIVAGLAVGMDGAGSEGDLLPVIVAFMSEKVAILAFTERMREQLSKAIADERIHKRLGTGTMPDTYNQSLRESEWLQTSNGLAEYLPVITNVESDAGRVTGASVETLEEIMLQISLRREHGDPIEFVLDPVALRYFEAILC